MTGNRVVVYKGPGEVSVDSFDYPTLELPEDVVSGLGVKKSAPHAAILKLARCRRLPRVRDGHRDLEGGLSRRPPMVRTRPWWGCCGP